jgi:hypothetical protein
MPEDTPMSPSPTETIPSAGSLISEVLALAPASAASVSVTDWTVIRAIEGVETVSRDPADPDRIRFIADIYARHATPAYFASAKLGRHAEAWGWDTTDLLWEAVIDVSTSPVHVLRLPASFDMAALAALFEERQFDRQDHGGTPLYSKRIVPSDRWVGASDLSIANTALLTDRQTLVLSRDVDGVRAVLDAQSGDERSLADEEWAEAATAALAGQAAVTIIHGPRLCEMFWAPWEDRELLLDELGPINEFEWLALGYHYANERPIASAILGFPDDESAAQDIGIRTLWASETSDAEFEVLGVDRRGSQLVFDFRPPSDQPRILFDLSWTNFFFAVC